MRLGTETGSVINHIHSVAVRGQPDPEIGMGCTLLFWSDRDPATVTEVTRKGDYIYIKVQSDHAKRVDSNGFSESQTYEYTPNPDGGVRTFRSKNGGLWESVYLNRETGRWKKGNGGLLLGVREKYHDFSF